MAWIINTYCQVCVSHSAQCSGRATNQKSSPRTDWHVRRCSHGNTTGESGILNVNLKTRKKWFLNIWPSLSDVHQNSPTFLHKTLCWNCGEISGLKSHYLSPCSISIWFLLSGKVATARMWSHKQQPMRSTCWWRSGVVQRNQEPLRQRWNWASTSKGKQYLNVTKC